MVLFALFISVMFVMVAIVIELGALRNDKQANKSAADFTVAAGMRGLDGGGRPQPWKGVCESIEYLKVNEAAFATFSTQRWMDGNGVDLVGGSPCSATTTLPYTDICNENPLDSASTRRTSWAWFTGVSADGRLVVNIKSGYDLGDGAFSDETLVASDTSARLGCDQFAVVITESQPRGFSKIIGTSELSTRTRSVGRVTIGQSSDAAVALLLLERSDCRAVRTVGNALILVQANGDRPGYIHADSNGKGSCPGGKNGQKVFEGSDLLPSNNMPDPSIKAENAVVPDANGVVQKAKISSPAVAESPAFANTPSPDTIGETAPVSGGIISRSPIDNRYLAAVRVLEAQRLAVLAGPVPSGPEWEVVSGSRCAPTGLSVEPPATSPPTVTKVWFNCNIDVPGSGDLRVRDGVTDVVVAGSVKVAGRLNFVNPRNVTVFGDKKGTKGIDVAGGTFSVNTLDPTGVAQCPDDLRTTVLFLRYGEVSSTTGNTILCQTFLYAANGGGQLPSGSGFAPSNNNFTGIVNIVGIGKVAWSAPNAVRGRLPTPADLSAFPFEDLALWTEAAPQSSIGGGGGMTLKGVFFLPNAKPFKINGDSGQTIDADAQFVARALELNGNATLSMAPSPFDSVPIPIFEDFALVR